jgi:hypothetical protein
MENSTNEKSYIFKYFTIDEITNLVKMNIELNYKFKKSDIKEIDNLHGRLSHLTLNQTYKCKMNWCMISPKEPFSDASFLVEFPYIIIKEEDFGEPNRPLVDRPLKLPFSEKLAKKILKQNGITEILPQEK